MATFSNSHNVMQNIALLYKMLLFKNRSLIVEKKEVLLLISRCYTVEKNNYNVNVNKMKFKQNQDTILNTK